MIERKKMKRTTKTILLGAIIVIAAVITFWPFSTPRAQAQLPPTEEYLIMPTTGHANLRRLEDELNRNARNGWKVRTAIKDAIILVK